MFNLLKADVYRLFKTRSYYAVGIILVAVILLMTYSLGAGNEPVGDLDFGVLLNNLLSNTMIPMIIGVGGAVYVCLDFSSGYIKNIASSIKSKATIAISKFITLTIGVTIYFILMILLTYVLGRLFIGSVVVNDMGIVLGYVGIVWFLHIVLMALVVLAASFFRGSAATITTVVSMFLIVQLLYLAIAHLFNISLVEYSPIMNFGRVSVMDSGPWPTIVGSASVVLVVYLLGASVLMQKKDIK